MQSILRLTLYQKWYIIYIYRHRQYKGDKNMNTKKYITYEEPFSGKKFSENEMMKLYNSEIVDKKEYEDYSDWMCDMLRSHIFEFLDNENEEKYFNNLYNQPIKYVINLEIEVSENKIVTSKTEFI